MRISDWSSDVCSSDLGIAQHELQLRPIEGALAGIQAVLQAGLLDGSHERALGLVPGGIVAGANGGPVGELHHQVLEAEVAVNLAQQVAEDHRLAVDLVRRAEDVGVVLGEDRKSTRLNSSH